MTEITDILTAATPVINEAIKQAFAEQGHHLTGAWEQSIYNVMEVDAVAAYALVYGSIVDAGTTPARIPYGGAGMPTGGTSQYIQGLFNFWKQRKPGLTDKEALSLAFATAKVQKKEGMSTVGSRAFSATGQRQRFIAETFAKNDDKINGAVLPGIDNFINERMGEPVNINY